MREGILITDRNRRRCLLLSFSLLVPAFGYDPYPATMPRNLVSGTVMCYQVYWTATSHKADATKAWTVFSWRLRHLRRAQEQPRIHARRALGAGTGPLPASLWTGAKTPGNLVTI